MVGSPRQWPCRPAGTDRIHPDGTRAHIVPATLESSSGTRGCSRSGWARRVPGIVAAVTVNDVSATTAPTRLTRAVARAVARALAAACLATAGEASAFDFVEHA